MQLSPTGDHDVQRQTRDIWHSAACTEALWLDERFSGRRRPHRSEGDVDGRFWRAFREELTSSATVQTRRADVCRDHAHDRQQPGVRFTRRRRRSARPPPPPRRDQVVVTHPTEWLADGARLAGSWQGAAHGAQISLIVNEIEDPGAGAALHQHPYAEIFVVHSGQVRFTIGTATLDIDGGHIVVAPPNVPHAFANLGTEPLVMTDIHEHATFETQWITPVPTA